MKPDQCTWCHFAVAFAVVVSLAFWLTLAMFLAAGVGGAA